MLPISGSPDISILDFSVLFDISGAIPAITLTNLSVGIPSGTTRLNLCTWWYVIVSPNGTPVHTGTQAQPDYPPSSSNWTTLSIAPNSWPTPFGTPPCGQVEFSSSVPYSILISVMDTAGHIYSYQKNLLLVRPNGNGAQTCGNFGAATVAIETKCADAKLYASDTTNYTYQGIFGATSGNTWTLRYPEGPGGIIPDNAVVNDVPYVLFNLGYAGKGYSLYLNTKSLYDLGGGCSVRVQYKLYDTDGTSVGNTFAVYCNVDLCALDCKMQEVYDLLSTTSAELKDPTLPLKAQRLSLLYTRVLTGVFQPLCGINVPAIIAEMEEIGGFTCDCGCGGNGINIGAPIAIGGNSGGCCPVTASIIDNGTGIAPAACPLSYFPVQVKDPTNTSVIGSAGNINDLVSILNATPAWQAYGTAFAEGNCKVGWYLISPTTTVPDINVILGAAVVGPSTYVDAIIDRNTNTAPVGCPTGNPYPLRVYNVANTNILGIVGSVADLVAALNADSGWSAFGVASVQDTCHVQFNLTVPTNIPPNIKVDNLVTSTGCTSNQQNYLVYMKDPCFPLVPITASSFPCNAIVDFGLGAGPIPLGIVSGWTALIAALNAASGKPASLTFFPSPSDPNSLDVKNTDCNAYPLTPVITCNSGSNDYLLFGANHTTMSGATPTQNGVMALGLSTNAVVGRIPIAIPGGTQPKHAWHTIKIGQYLIVSEGDTGKIYFYDITNPLAPTLARIIQLNDTGSGTCFTGAPNTMNFQSSGAVSSIYSLYFPTDYYSNMNLQSIFVFEATTGSAWEINFYGTGSGVIASFHDAKLLGKCPRIYLNGTIYFTQDGDLETRGSLSSGVGVGFVVLLDTGTFSSGGLSTLAIFNGVTPEYVWAASYDGAGQIYFSGVNASVATVLASSNGIIVINININPLTTFRFRLNTVIINGFILFVTNQLQVGSSFPPAMLLVTTASLATGTPVLSSYSGSPVQNVFNVIAVGPCTIAMTTIASSGIPQSVLIYGTPGLSGRGLIATITIPEGGVYNLIPIPKISVYTPNTFILP